MNCRLFAVFSCLLGLGIGAGIVGPGCGGCDWGTEEPIDCGDALLCSDETCHECCNSSDCDADHFCDENFSCVVDCEGVGWDCFADPFDCCPDLACDPHDFTCREPCETDADCEALQRPYAERWACEDGVCGLPICDRSAECNPADTCLDGVCLPKPACEEIADCIVLPGQGLLIQDGEIQLAAYALLQDGRLSGGHTFSWSSLSPDIARVSSGRVVGGERTGSTTILASVDGCELSCAMDVQNLPAPTADQSLVLVTEAETGAPVDGATVAFEGGPSGQTDERGAVLFEAGPSAEAPLDLTLSHANFHYQTVRQQGPGLVSIVLDRLPDPDSAAGVRGVLPFDRLACGVPGHPCEVRMGLAGASIPLRLHRLDAASLAGEPIRTHISLGIFSEELGIPGGLVLGINDTFYRDQVMRSAQAGLRPLWGLFGRSNLAVLIEYLGPYISAGDSAGAKMMIGMLAGLNVLSTDVGAVLDLEALDRVADVNDLDLDGDRGDLVPDYEGFPETNLQPRVEARYTLSVHVPSLKDSGYDSVLLLAGADLPGLGFVPLGIGAWLADWEEDVEQPVQVRVAEVAGRLPLQSAQLMLIALAFNADSFDQDRVQKKLAGQIVRLSHLRSDVIQLAPFMPQAEVDWDALRWRLTVTELPEGTDLVQGFFHDQSDQGWFILAGPDDSSFVLPLAPPEGDRAQGAALLSVRMREGLDPAELTNLTGPRLDLVAKWVDAFSYTEAGLP